MPNRYLREGILTSERVNKLAPQAEVFYRRVMSVVDDYGRFEANPKLLRAACFPLRVDEVREADISRWLTEVESAGLIALYAVNNKNYLELSGLGEPRAKSSKYPAPLSRVNTCAQAQTSAPYSPTPSSAPSIPPTANACAPGIREALAWAGVGGGQKKCEEVPGLTPIGIVLLAEEIKKTNGGPGLIVQKITDGYTPPKLIAAETLSRLSRQGRIASICGHEVRASDGGSNVAYSTNGVLVISDQGVETRLKSNEILAEQIVVKLDKELA